MVFHLYQKMNTYITHFLNGKLTKARGQLKVFLERKTTTFYFIHTIYILQETRILFWDYDKILFGKNGRSWGDPCGVRTAQRPTHAKVDCKLNFVVFTQNNEL